MTIRGLRQVEHVGLPTFPCSVCARPAGTWIPWRARRNTIPTGRGQTGSVPAIEWLLRMCEDHPPSFRFPLQSIGLDPEEPTCIITCKEECFSFAQRATLGLIVHPSLIMTTFLYIPRTDCMGWPSEWDSVE